MIILGSEVREYLPSFLQHYNELTSEDRHNRFFNTMSPSAIRDWLLSIDEDKFNLHNFFILSLNDKGEFVGVSHLVISKDFLEGEIAISIVPSAQGHGIGTKLIGDIIDIAKNEDIAILKFNCNSGNQACRNLFAKMGFTVKYDSDMQYICGYRKMRE